MTERAAPDDLLALVDRAREVAAKVDGADAFEIRADARRDWKLGLQEGRPLGTILEEGGALGVLVFVGDQSAYVHTLDPRLERVAPLVERGIALARAKRARGWRASAVAKEPVRHRRAVYAPPRAQAFGKDAEGEAVSMLRRVCDAAREAAPGSRPHASFGIRVARSVMTDSVGSWVDLTSLVSTVHSTASLQEPRFGEGSARRGGQLTVADQAEGDAPERIGREAAERAVESSRAEPLPSGRYAVLCDNNLAGTLAHESFGHLTEYDLVASGWSALRGRRGEKLAVDSVSITDAPVVPDSQGVAVPFDDQGTRAEPVTMLKDGVLSAWLHTRESAHEEGDEPAGNGRALDARFPSIVRMRNTYFEPGDRTVEEALEELGDGLYLCGARGGAPHSDGTFMFTALRGWKVENGKPTVPVRTASIHGNVLDFLRKVECLTKDFSVSTNYFGGCGKGEQSFLHVGIGGPHVLVRDAIVGGA